MARRWLANFRDWLHSTVWQADELLSVNDRPYLIAYSPVEQQTLQTVSSIPVFLAIFQFILEVYLIVHSIDILALVSLVGLMLSSTVLLALAVVWILLLYQNHMRMTRKGIKIIFISLAIVLFSLAASIVLVRSDDNRMEQCIFNSSQQKVGKWLKILTLVCNCVDLASYMVIISIMYCKKHTSFNQQQLLIAQRRDAIELKDLLQAAYDSDRLHFAAGAA